MELPYSNMQATHWNPGASMPLIVPIQMICNTSDELLQRNVRINSGRPNKWLRESPAHSGIAIMCGSGPSLADSLGDIRAMARLEKSRLVAMNGAAAYLASQRIMPDYQVIVDARPETAALVGPARQHLFASQCAPETFEASHDAILWHQEIGGIETFFDPVNADRGYVLIGGAGSVGNSALCVAYAMGYRDLHLFGYDSSHRDGDGHAFDQPLNNGDPCALVRFRGKEYLVSLTMKLQVDRFLGLTAPALKQSGCKITVHGTGLLPDMYNAASQGLSEAEKYREMWKIPGYREMSPGEMAAEEFVRVAGVTKRSHVIDFGCGTGRGALAISRLSGAAVTLVDFAGNCCDHDVKHMAFVQADITVPGIFQEYADTGFCCDVLEHLPSDHVAPAIRNIMSAVPRCYFQIATVPDLCGAFIGEILHLSVHEPDWWADTFRALGFAVTWRVDKENAVAMMVGRD